MKFIANNYTVCIKCGTAKFLIEITTDIYHIQSREKRITSSPSFNGKFKLLLLNSYQNNSKPSVIKSFLWYLRVNLLKP